MGQTKSRLNDEAIVLKQERNTRAFGSVGFCETKGTRRPLIACEAQYSKREPQFYLDLNHPNLVTPLVYDAHFKEFLGLNAQGVTFYFDYLDVSLEDIVLSRKVRNSIFPEQEILNVGLAILSSLLYLKEFDIEGGNIEPCTVFYDKGQIKIYVNQLILGRLASYKMITSQFQRKPLPSPEVLYATKNREVELVEKYRYETDIFTLGLTLLEMATLEKSNELFNIEIRQVNVKKLDQRYAVLKQRYSDRLNNLIKQMLTMDPRNRPTCESLINQIRSGVIAGVPSIVSRGFGVRSVSLSRMSPSMNQSFLNTSQISGLKSSNLQIHPIPIATGGSRIVSVERRGSLTGTHPLTTPSGSRIIQVQQPLINTENGITLQTKPNENGEQQQNETEVNKQIDIQENSSVRSLPQKQQIRPEISHIAQRSITSRPQIITSNVPQNYLPPQYLTPQTVRYVPAPPFQTSSNQRGIVSPPLPAQQQQQQQQQPQQQQQYYSIQQQIPSNVGQYPTQRNIQSTRIPPQQIQYAQSVRNTSNQVPIRNVFNNNLPVNRQQVGSFIQYPGQPVYTQPSHPQHYYQQPTISSPQVQRNQINNLLQNHQTETGTRMQSLGQKVQELDERVSKSIANSVKVTQQHQNDERQSDEHEDN